MKDFNDLQSLWQQQDKRASDSVDKIIGLAQEQKMKSVKKHRAGILVLSITSFILITIWIFTPFANPVGYGLSIMILALAIRVVLEVYSYNRMKQIDITDVSEAYQQNIKAFYKLRKQLVSYVTAIAVVFYIGGFAMMIPTFKQTLPSWFYWYIIAFLIIGIPVSVYFLVRQARNEIKDLEKVLDQL